MSNVRVTQVPGELAQYNGWTGVELLALVGTLDAENQQLKFLNSEERQTIDDLSRLCIRAADALERVDKNWPNEDYGQDAKLIAELRKAAE